MFVRSYVEIHAPFAEVEVAFLRQPGRWLPTITEQAEVWGARLLASVGLAGRGALRREVQLDVGRALRAPGKAIIPLRWQPTRAAGLFPVMEADLELTALGPDVTQLSFDGRYTPPFGVAGKLADRALLHRVAEATVRDLVQRVAERLEAVTPTDTNPSLISQQGLAWPSEGPDEPGHEPGNGRAGRPYSQTGRTAHSPSEVPTEEEQDDAKVHPRAAAVAGGGAGAARDRVQHDDDHAGRRAGRTRHRAR